MAKPRLLLFGSPGAGKSSLLGALAQAAHLEAPALKGTLVDKTGELARVQKNTYEGTPPATETLETHDIRLEPANGHASTAEARLLDCSGQEALELLKKPEAFDRSHPLHRHVLDADAVLLLIDASLPGKQLLEHFQQFGQWLAKLHETRGKRTMIGDLPVYLVLTKCDTLGKKEDTFAKWVQKIEEAKRKIDQKFREYLRDEGTGFGSLDVKMSATAIKRPTLADRPAKDTEPFGVAELFRESLDAAADCADRRQISQRRLQNVLFGLVGLISILVLVLAFLAEWQPDTHAASLEEKAFAVLPKKDLSPAVRLNGTMKKLEEKEKTLIDVEQDASFTRLPAEVQAAVQKYRRELEDYRVLTDKMNAAVKFPFTAKTEEEFTAQEKSLASFTYPGEWADTPLGKHVAKCKRQYERVREELKKEEEWLTAQAEMTNKLLDDGTDLYPRLRKLRPKLLKKTTLTLQEEDLLKEADAWEAKCHDQLQPNWRASRTDNIPGVSAVTYEYLDKFESLKEARRRLDAVKVSLRSLASNIQEELKVRS